MSADLLLAFMGYHLCAETFINWGMSSGPSWAGAEVIVWPHLWTDPGLPVTCERTDPCLLSDGPCNVRGTAGPAQCSRPLSPLTLTYSITHSLTHSLSLFYSLSSRSLLLFSFSSPFLSCSLILPIPPLSHSFTFFLSLTLSLSHWPTHSITPLSHSPFLPLCISLSSSSLSLPVFCTSTWKWCHPEALDKRKPTTISWCQSLG